MSYSHNGTGSAMGTNNLQLDTMIQMTLTNSLDREQSDVKEYVLCDSTDAAF